MTRSTEAKTPAEKFWMDLVARLPCLICSRFEPTGLPVCLHHIAEGSSQRFHCGVVPLCAPKRGLGGHHTGGPAFGLHPSVKSFCAFWRVPWEKEEGLLVWLAEDVAKYLRTMRVAFP